MRTQNWTVEAAAAAIMVVGAAATADITVTQSSIETSYSTTVNFDEVGGPTGGGIAADAWAGIGLADIQSGTGLGNVADVSGINPWVNSGNAFEGAFGVFMTFDSDLSDFSAQFWDPSGAPGPFGGGMGIFIFDDGVEVGSLFVTPAWGGLGDTWIDIAATGGMVFDEVRVLGFGFGPTTYMDNASWNTVPTPGALAVLGLGGLVGARRRRA